MARERHAERNAEIRRRVAAGESIASTARAMGLSVGVAWAAARPEQHRETQRRRQRAYHARQRAAAQQAAQ